MHYIQLSKQQQNKCLEQLGYRQEQLDVDTRSLRTWLNEQSYLPSSRKKESDGFLRAFLLGTKGSLETSKRKIDNYYTFRGSGSPIYGKYDPTSEETVALEDFMQIGFVPNSLDDGTRIWVVRPNSRITSNQFLPCIQSILMSFELELRREDIWSMSLVMIFDFKEAKVSEFLKTNPFHMKDMFYTVQEIFPFRIKKILYVNLHPTLVTAGNYLVKPFLSKKINERLTIMSDGVDAFTDILPRNIAPVEIGGHGTSLLSITGDFFKSIKEKRDWFVSDLREMTNEEERPASAPRVQHYNFGTDGSFKSLVVD